MQSQDWRQAKRTKASPNRTWSLHSNPRFQTPPPRNATHAKLIIIDRRTIARWGGGGDGGKDLFCCHSLAGALCNTCDCVTAKQMPSHHMCMYISMYVCMYECTNKCDYTDTYGQAMPFSFWESADYYETYVMYAMKFHTIAKCYANRTVMQTAVQKYAVPKIHSCISFFFPTSTNTIITYRWQQCTLCIIYYPFFFYYHFYYPHYSDILVWASSLASLKKVQQY